MLKTPYNHAVQACASGLKFGIMVEDNPFRLWKCLWFLSLFFSFLPFFLLQNAFYLTANQARRSTESLWPSHWFWLPFHLWTLSCELHFSEAEYLKAKLSRTASVCNSRMILRLIFSFPLQSSRTFPLEILLELELVGLQQIYLKCIYVIYFLHNSPPTMHSLQKVCN